MRQAMADAEVGDDVVDFDPTTRRLEETVAELLGKEAAAFAPSGTMSNQLGLRVHCQPGDEFLCDTECHIVRYEQGGYAQLSGLVAHDLPGQRGVLTVEQLDEALPPEDEHCTRAKLVCVENTHNRGGGHVYPQNRILAIADWAKSHGLAMHLDGARLWNAHIATGLSLGELAAPFDTVSVCFSKGLGAPVGSALVGSRELIAKARRARKMFGGGMRQSGIIAAGALFALSHHLDRMIDDHRRAKTLAEELDRITGLSCEADTVETNIVLFDVDPALGTAQDVCDRLAEAGVLVIPFGRQQVRAVTHLDIDDADLRTAITRIDRALSGRTATADRLSGE